MSAPSAVLQRLERIRHFLRVVPCYEFRHKANQATPTSGGGALSLFNLLALLSLMANRRKALS